MTIDFKKLKSWCQFKREAEMELLDDDLYSVMCGEFLQSLNEFAITNEQFSGKTLTVPGNSDAKIQKIFVHKFNADISKHDANWRIFSTSGGDYVWKQY